MNRMVVLFALFPLLLAAQFAELSTTFDGGHLYFSSTLKWKGQPADRGELRVYRVTETGAIELYAERGGSLTPQNSYATGDGARTPQVSADGQTVAFTLQGTCEAADGCPMGSKLRAEVRGRHAAVLGDGVVYLSANARWALLVPPMRGSFGSVPIANPDATLFDLENGTRVQLPPPPSRLARPVANDGSVVVDAPGEAPNITRRAIWKNGELSSIALPGSTSLWGRSDDGAVLLYNALTPGGAASVPVVRLMARVLATSQDTVIYSGQQGELPQFLGVTGDGRRVLYRVSGRSIEGPAYIADTVTGATTPIPLPTGELATAGTLSSTGDVAFVVTTTGRIARVDLARGTVTSAVPPTPYVSVGVQYAPGSRLRLEGALPHTRAALDGAIQLADRALSILAVDENQIVAQVPWELDGVYEPSLRVDIASDSPFQQNEKVHIAGMSPRFEGTPPAGVGLPGVAVKGDFSGVLTADPQPGEVFHMYLTGLGAVTGPIATGQPTPLFPLLPIRGEFVCRFRPYTENAETLFAGLAPGLIAIYQVTFRMPATANPGRILGGYCTVAWSGGGGSLSWTSLP